MARILHFIDSLAAGGAERQLVYLLENLDRARYESHVLTTYDTFRHYEPELKRLRVPFYSLNHGELRLANRLGALHNYVRLMWSLRPEIVHSWLHYPNLIARAARPFCPSHRLITAIRSQYTLRQSKIESHTSWLSDFRIVINNTLHDEQHIFRRNNIITITSGVNLEQFYQNPPIPPPEGFTAIMVARIDPRKDHLTLLNALALLQQELPTGFKLILIGEVTSPKTQQQLDTLIQHHNLGSLIFQKPPTYNIAPYYHQANISILPSQSEGFPNVILESFAAGKPAIVSDAANQTGLVIHNVNGWVFPAGDSQALATALQSAWQTSPAQRNRMGALGQTQVTKYSINTTVEQYSQLYERALSRS